MNLNFFIRISCLVLLIGFTSCGGGNGEGGEESKAEISKDKLTGEWLLTELTTVSGSMSEPLTVSTFEFETTWKFDKDGKYTKVSNGQTMTTNVKWALKDELKKGEDGKDYKVLEIITGSLAKELHLLEANGEKVVVKEFMTKESKDYSLYTFKRK